MTPRAHALTSVHATATGAATAGSIADYIAPACCSVIWWWFLPTPRAALVRFVFLQSCAPFLPQWLLCDSMLVTVRLPSRLWARVFMCGLFVSRIAIVHRAFRWARLVSS